MVRDKNDKTEQIFIPQLRDKLFQTQIKDDNDQEE